MTSIDILASQQALVASLPLESTPCVKRRRLCFENLEPSRKRAKSSLGSHQPSAADPVAKKSENCLKPPTLVSTPKQRSRSPSLDTKDGDRTPPCAAESQSAKHSLKKGSRNSPSKPTDASHGSIPTLKKNPRPALQTIHIKALEHGLRIPVNSTPLGTLDKSENIIYGSLSSPSERSMSARPAVAIGTGACHARDTMALARRPLASCSAAGVRGSQSAPASPVRPKKFVRRNTARSEHS
ncbi:hypothetical protein FB639_000351, partial [Coemansia asiatica]